jgi:hypothetical protein
MDALLDYCPLLSPYGLRENILGYKHWLQLLGENFYSYLYYAGTNVDPVAYAHSLAAFTLTNIQEFMLGLGVPQGK